MDMTKENQIELKHERKLEERSERRRIYTALFIIFILLITSIILYLHLKSARQIRLLFMNHDMNSQEYYHHSMGHIEQSLKTRPELEDTKINPYVHANLLNNENKCDKSTEILIAVTSASNSFTQRAHIRWTWAQKIQNLETAFFLGNENDTILNLNLIEENKFHKDIIQGDYKELKYQETGMEKYMHILKWTHEFCPDVGFVFLVNESNYLEPGNLKSFSKSLDPNEAMIIGHLQPMRYITITPKPGHTPNNDQNQNYPFKALPDFIKGPTLLSRAAVLSMVEFMEYIYPKQLPHIFLGNLAMNLNIPIKNDELFHGEKSPIYSDIIASEGYGEVDDLLLEWRKHHDDKMINR